LPIRGQEQAHDEGPQPPEADASSPFDGSLRPKGSDQPDDQERQPAERDESSYEDLHLEESALHREVGHERRASGRRGRRRRSSCGPVQVARITDLESRRRRSARQNPHRSRDGYVAATDSKLEDDRTGVRVSSKTHAPPFMPGMLSTGGQRDQSSAPNDPGCIRPAGP
jgi:hypothetical protein